MRIALSRSPTIVKPPKKYLTYAHIVRYIINKLYAHYGHIRKIEWYKWNGGMDMLSEKVQKLEQENIALKAQVEELQNICGTNAKVPKNCEYCSNFVQHYGNNGSGFYPMYTGHCVAGNRLKTRKSDETCKAFVKRTYGKNYL